MDWEDTLDVDDSDILLRPCNRRTTTTTSPNTTAAVELSQSQPISLSQSKSQALAPSQSKSQTLDSSHLQSETLESPLLYTIPGPAGLIQAAKLRKKLDNQEHPMDTQDYIRKGGEDPEEDDDLKNGPWLSAMEFAYPDGGKSRLGEIKDYMKNGKLDKVVAVIKSCVPDALGDLTVVLKDTTGTISGTIHHKVLTEGEFAKGIRVGSVLILHKVSVFSPSRSAHSLNITKRNLVKIFYKDGGSSQIQISQGSAQDSGRGPQVMHSDFSVERRSEGFNLSTNRKQSLHIDVEQETHTISSFRNQSRKTSNHVKGKEILKEADATGSCENEPRAIENVAQVTEQGNKNGPKGTNLHLEPAKVVATLPDYTDEQLDILADIENDMF